MFNNSRFTKGQAVALYDTVYTVVDIYIRRTDIPPCFATYIESYDTGETDIWYLLSPIADGSRIIAPGSYLSQHNFPLFTTLN